MEVSKIGAEELNSRDTYLFAG